jgi:radical SAM superfamily enzyme YgiQ (UPF0313 family)
MIEGQMLRRHSRETSIERIAQWQKAGVHKFFFVDNTFNLPLSYGKGLCRRLIDRDLGIKWSSILYPKYVDQQLADAMARAGCEQVSIGFESGSEKILKGMSKRFTLQAVRHISG